VKQSNLQAIYENPEDLRIATIILRTIFGLLAAFLIVIGLAFYAGDMTLLKTILAAAITLAIPAGLLFLGNLRLSSFLLLLLIVTFMTISAIQGQGLHDIAILTYPVAIFFANLVLGRRDFFWFSLLILGAVGYLGLGEAYGWYFPKENLAPIAVDFGFVIIILLIALLIADSLGENIRKNIDLAQKEITVRKKMESQLRHLSTHDKLTGIYNRSFFDEMLALIERGRQYPVSLIFADMDNLKAINDKQGHKVGDELLKLTARTFSGAFRAGDILARIGGDEFAVLLPETDVITADIILARLRSILDEHNARNPDLPLNVSLGVSTAEKGDLQKSFIIADQRMYEDKSIRKPKGEQ
jgi:diguanylate cyclase (GGDEF)-like protein